jgi:PAS domain S-box-containing protein
MDNIFSSITSGVLTTDIDEKILLCNRSAESILGLDSKTIIGKTIHQAFPPFPSSFQDELKNVIKNNKTIIGLEISPSIPPRGVVDLRLSLAPLKNMENDTQGVAIVLDDLTEKKQLEAQSRLFEKMVSPAVIQQLNPNELELGGKRTELTAMFADIRGFTSFSESLAPEKLVTVLNHYLSEAAEAILHEEGTIDKFMGDAVMAWFNAPIPQIDHSLRAIKSALAIQKSIKQLHRIYAAEFRLSFGIGIHSGEAVLGLVGNEKRLEYTAIGDSINTTKRIQENSKAGQILISSQVYEKVKNDVNVKLNDVIIAKGKKHPIEVFEVLSLKD